MSALPNKYVPLEHSLIGVSSVLLEELEMSDTVSALWDRVRSNERVRTFDRFADGLTLLYAAKLVSFRDGILRRREASDA
jgi:hypothetical protein